MNKEQYGIVMTMKAIGISATKFAKAVNEPVAKMKRAYSTATFEQYKNWYEATDMMDKMGI